jgi:hypothetical protein
MTSRRGIMICVAVTAMAAGLGAQTSTTTKEAGKTEVTTEQITGEVVLVDKNILLARMQPSGQYRMFNIQPTQQFMIDGKSKRLNDLTPGTFLTATAITTRQPITVRTATLTNGTVWYVQGNYVIITLDNGQQREYTVPDGFMFTAEGKPATVKDLRKGMKVSATKIVAAPTSEISKEIVITGKGPK